MYALTPVQISELVTLLDDAISSRISQVEHAPTFEDGVSRSRMNNEIDHLEAELAWIQWMRENHPDHEENGFPASEVEEHVKGMETGIEHWHAKLQEEGAGNDVNYIQSLENSIAIVSRILNIFSEVCSPD